MAETHVGEAYDMDERLTVIGQKREPGEATPDHSLDYLDPSDSASRMVRIANSAGTVRLLNVVNSLDTPVCHIETRHWGDLRGELSEGVSVNTTSMDLPFAHARWRTVEGVTHQTLSSHRNEAFGRGYGVLIKKWRLLQRAVFVIDRDDRIIYAGYVADQMHKPGYAAAMAAVHGVIN